MPVKNGCYYSRATLANENVGENNGRLLLFDAFCRRKTSHVRDETGMLVKQSHKAATCTHTHTHAPRCPPFLRFFFSFQVNVFVQTRRRWRNGWRKRNELLKCFALLTLVWLSCLAYPINDMWIEGAHNSELIHLRILLAKVTDHLRSLQIRKRAG